MTTDNNNVKPIERTQLLAGATGALAGLRQNMAESAEQRHMTAAARELFEVRKPASFERIAATFDELEHVSTVKGLEKTIVAMEKAAEKQGKEIEKLTKAADGKGKVSIELKNALRELSDTEAAFQSIFGLLGVQPEDLEAIVANIDADLAIENATLIAAVRANNAGRLSTARLLNVTAKS